MKKAEKIDELTLLLKRIQADFENYKKRIGREQREFAAKANKEMIKQMLPVLDSFEIALNNQKNSGFEMVYQQFLSLLKNQGLEPIGAEGKFDPYKHEALMQEEADEEGIILEEFQKGYKFREDIIRPAKVKVSKLRSKELNY